MVTAKERGDRGEDDQSKDLNTCFYYVSYFIQN